MNLLNHYDVISKILIALTVGLSAGIMYKLLYPGKGYAYLKGVEFAGMIRRGTRSSAYESSEPG